MAHANTVAIYSDGRATDVRIEFGTYPRHPAPATDTDIAFAPPWQPPTWGLNAAVSNDAFVTVRREGAGDGTVPAVSGPCPGLTLAKPADLGRGAEHSSVYADPRFQAAAVQMIKMLLAVYPGTSMGT